MSVMVIASRQVFLDGSSVLLPPPQRKGPSPLGDANDANSIPAVVAAYQMEVESENSHVPRFRCM